MLPIFVVVLILIGLLGSFSQKDICHQLPVSVVYLGRVCRTPELKRKEKRMHY